MSITHRVKRLLVAGVAGAMVLSLMPAGVAAADTSDVCEGAPESTFTDSESIAEVHAFNVNCMAAYGITGGFEDGSFGPGLPVTRQQMASFIARLATQALNGNLDIPQDSPAVFDDVAEDNVHAAAINWLFELGITTGVSETEYNPSGNVTREQMASFIARAHEVLGVFEIEAVQELVAAFDGDPFSDIDDASEVHRPNIEILQAVGVIGGFADGTYRPGDDVTRQQMSRFIMESAAILNSLGLWNGVFIGVDPTDPEEPETPDTPETPEPEPVPTNMAYTFDPAGAITAPTGTELEFTVDVGDAEEVTVWLLDADTVELDGMILSLNLDDDGDLDPGPVSGADAEIVEIDGTAQPAQSVARTVDVEDGEIEVKIVGNASPTQLYVVVTEGDDEDVIDEDGDLVGVEDDVFTMDFGASGLVTFADVAGLALVNAATEELIVGTETFPTESTIVVAAAMLTDADGNDLTPPSFPPFVDEDDAEDIVVPVSGESVEFIVVQNVNNNTSCDAIHNAQDAIAVGSVYARGTAPVNDGLAVFSYEGPEDPAYHCIVANWEGAEDGLYDVPGAEAVSFGTGTFAGAIPSVKDSSAHGWIFWDDRDPFPANLEFVEDEAFTLVGGAAVVRAEVTDQFGNPVAGATIKFEVATTTVNTATGGNSATAFDNPTNALQSFNRVTNAAGVATLSYVSNTNGLQAVQASWEAPAASGLANLATDPALPAHVFTYAAATQTVPVAFATGSVVSYNAASNWLLLNASDAEGASLGYYSFTFGTGDLFTVGGSASTLAAFKTALANKQTALTAAESYWWQDASLASVSNYLVPNQAANFGFTASP